METPEPEPVLSLGWQVIDWVETYLVHGPGDVQGDPISLDDELARFLVDAYAVDLDGRRLYDEAMLVAPKGRAKSELAGMVVCAEALGPVRFAGWDAAGEPVGRPVTYPFIRCLATEESQAGNTYDNVVFMLRNGAVASEYRGLDVGLTRTYLPDGGEVRPSTASSAAKDGGKESFAVADEPHLYVLPESVGMYRTVKRNLTKRRAAEPWMLGTTTVWRPGEGSIAEQIFDSARTTPRTLIAYRPPPKVDLDDDASVLRALSHVYGPAFEWMDKPRLLRALRDPTADRADQQRYFLNAIVKGSDRWLSPEVWAACARPGQTLDPGDAVVLGFDGSQYEDSTVLEACRISDGHLVCLNCWEKPAGPAGRGWEVPRQEVHAAVAAAFSDYKVALMFADPPYWQSELAAWQSEWGDRVLGFETRRDVGMAGALERLHTAVVTGQVTHDGDPRVSRHVGNATTVRSRAGTLIRKPVRGGPDKIDGAVSATLAYEARAEALAKGLGAPEASVYEERGLVVL